MSMCNLVFLIVAAVYGVSNPANGLKKDWTYKLVQINWNSTNPDVFRTPLRTVRVGPGVYGINGPIFVGEDIGDEYQIEASLLRSASGSSEYAKTPFSVPPNTITKIINSQYKSLIMADIKSCSNLPQFEDEWVPPLKKGEYEMNSCVISTDNFPSHLPTGFYKVVLTLTGPSASLVVELIAQVDPALM